MTLCGRMPGRIPLPYPRRLYKNSLRLLYNASGIVVEEYCFVEEGHIAPMVIVLDCAIFEQFGFQP